MSDPRQTWRTPPRLYAGLSRWWGPFDVDLAACAESALAPRYFDEEADALAPDSRWGPGWRAFCNPPFKRVAPWVDKAHRAMIEEGTLSVWILPASVNSAWLGQVERRGKWWRFNRRPQFVPPEGVKASTNSRDCILVAFDPSTERTTGYQGIVSALDGLPLGRA